MKSEKYQDKDLIFHKRWTGKLCSVNKWKDVRSIPNKNPKTRGRRPFIAMMYETAEYKSFKESLTIEFAGPRLMGKVDMWIKQTSWKMRDTGNIEKPIGDALEAAGVLQNDRDIRDVYIERFYNGRDEPDYLEVMLYRAVPVMEIEV